MLIQKQGFLLLINLFYCCNILIKAVSRYFCCQRYQCTIIIHVASVRRFHFFVCHSAFSGFFAYKQTAFRTTINDKNPVVTSASSSSVNSFFFTTFSWFLKLNSAAFFCSLANLLSYFDTFFKAGLILQQKS